MVFGIKVHNIRDKARGGIFPRYTSDTACETGITPFEGLIYENTDLDILRIYRNGAWYNFVNSLLSYGIRQEEFTIITQNIIPTLDETPLDIESVMVFIDGNKQINSDYSVSGKTVVWSGITLETQTEIEVVYFVQRYIVGGESMGKPWLVQIADGDINGKEYFKKEYSCFPVANGDIKEETHSEQTSGQYSITSVATDRVGLTGAHSILIKYINSSGEHKEEEVILTTSPINTVETDIAFVNSISVESAGTNNSNNGLISLYSQIGGAGNIVSSIKATKNWSKYSKYFTGDKSLYIQKIKVTIDSTASDPNFLISIVDADTGKEIISEFMVEMDAFTGEYTSLIKVPQDCIFNVRYYGVTNKNVYLCIEGWLE